MCFESKYIKLRLAEFVIAGVLLIGSLSDGTSKAQPRLLKMLSNIDITTLVVWVVMLAKNLDSNNVITTSQVGWSLWLAVASTGSYLVALVLFCIHRIDLGASYYKRSTYAESREYLQRF